MDRATTAPVVVSSSGSSSISSGNSGRSGSSGTLRLPVGPVVARQTSSLTSGRSGAASNSPKTKSKSPTTRTTSSSPVLGAARTNHYQQQQRQKHEGTVVVPSELLTMLEKAQNEIRKWMREDSFKRFMTTKAFQQLTNDKVQLVPSTTTNTTTTTTTTTTTIQSSSSQWKHYFHQYYIVVDDAAPAAAEHQDETQTRTTTTSDNKVYMAFFSFLRDELAEGTLMFLRHAHALNRYTTSTSTSSTVRVMQQQHHVQYMELFGDLYDHYIDPQAPYAITMWFSPGVRHDLRIHYDTLLGQRNRDIQYIVRCHGTLRVRTRPTTIRTLLRQFLETTGITTTTSASGDGAGGEDDRTPRQVEEYYLKPRGEGHSQFTQFWEQHREEMERCDSEQWKQEEVLSSQLSLFRMLVELEEIPFYKFEFLKRFHKAMETHVKEGAPEQVDLDASDRQALMNVYSKLYYKVEDLGQQ